MSNEELAKQIASDLFTGAGDAGTKAKHLRMYTDFGEDGRYLAGWSESGMAYRIEYLLDEAGITTPPSARKRLGAACRKRDESQQQRIEAAIRNRWSLWKSG